MFDVFCFLAGMGAQYLLMRGVAAYRQFVEAMDYDPYA